MPAPKGNQYAIGSEGRPSTYDPKYARMAQVACEKGFTDYEVMKLLGISQSTLYDWKIKYEEFSKAFRVGKEINDERVVASLYHKAIGYTHKKTVFVGKDAIEKTVEEHIPPDTGAAIFWLKNRQGKLWKDMRQMEVGGPGDFAAMTEEELRMEIEKLDALMIDVTPTKGK